MKLSEKTKKLFNAPWYVKNYMHIVDKNDNPVGVTSNMYTSKKVSHLPELYEALMEAKNEIYIILNEWALGKSEVEYLESYKKRKGRENHEFFNEIQELLKKVQEGK